MTVIEPTGQGTIRIVRRQILKDILRRYTVFVDQVPVGRVAAFQTGVYSVNPGRHSVQLRIVNTGKSCSEELFVTVGINETRVLRTTSLGFKDVLLIPLGIINPDRFAPRPWIRLEVDALGT